MSIKQLLAYPKNVRLQDSRVHPLKRAVKGQRDEIASGKKTPLKKKSMNQLQAEINQDYFRAWRLARARSASDDSLDRLGELSLPSIKSVFSLKQSRRGAAFPAR